MNKVDILRIFFLGVMIAGVFLDLYCIRTNQRQYCFMEKIAAAMILTGVAVLLTEEFFG
ncbi:hypothetical protein [Hornefia butyriciproducens]|uniref:hypothetical protein n=1 Tax=Hornefia butyriciproducens TaxID=2652293 RepID=UPI003F8BE567